MPAQSQWLVYLPEILEQLRRCRVSSGIAVGAYQVLKTWVDARNGRKLKIKVGDIEVEATQMKEEDMLRIFELLQEKADRKKIRDLLIATSQVNPPEAVEQNWPFCSKVAGPT